MVLSWTRARLYVVLCYYYSHETLNGQELNGFVT